MTATPSPPQATTFTYRLDADDRIVEVSDSWDGFAESNDGSDLVRHRVLGRSLWDFIQQPDVQQIYRHLVDHARENGKILRFPFRCDSPEVLRGLEMEIKGEPDRSVLFKTRINWTTARPEALPLLKREKPRSGRQVKVCSWCKRMELEDGRWVELDIGVQQSSHFGGARVPELSHGICPECREVFFGELLAAEGEAGEGS